MVVKILRFVILVAAMSLLVPRVTVTCADEAACCSAAASCPVCDACAPAPATVSPQVGRHDVVSDRTAATMLRLAASAVPRPPRVAWDDPLHGVISYRLRGPPA